MDDKVPNQIWVEFRPMPPSSLVGIMSYHEDPRGELDGNNPVHEFTRTDHVVSTIRQQGVRFTLTNDLVDAICDAVKGD